MGQRKAPNFPSYESEVLKVEMPRVIECDATECAYNVEQMCHAMAITVGGEIDHKCDTFCRSSSKGGDLQIIAGVGACKVGTCSNNTNLECTAPGIKVGHEGNEIDCLTFSPS